jgi:hypothetical protein
MSQASDVNRDTTKWASICRFYKHAVVMSDFDNAISNRAIF